MGLDANATRRLLESVHSSEQQGTGQPQPTSVAGVAGVASSVRAIAAALQPSRLVSVCLNNMLSTGSHRRHLRHLRRLGLEAPCRQFSIDLYWCGFVDLRHLTQTSCFWDRHLLTTACMSVSVVDWMLPFAHRWALGMVIKVSPELQMSILNRRRRAVACILFNVADAY